MFNQKKYLFKTNKLLFPVFWLGVGKVLPVGQQPRANVRQVGEVRRVLVQVHHPELLRVGPGGRGPAQAPTACSTLNIRIIYFIEELYGGCRYAQKI